MSQLEKQVLLYVSEKDHFQAAQQPEADAGGTTPPQALEWLLDSALEQWETSRTNELAAQAKAVCVSLTIDSCAPSSCRPCADQVLAVPRGVLAVDCVYVEVCEPPCRDSTVGVALIVVGRYRPWDEDYRIEKPRKPKDPLTKTRVVRCMFAR